MSCHPRRLVRYAALAAAFAFSTLSAWAQSTGHLRLVVTTKGDGKPVSGAKIVLHDPANERPDINLETDAEGAVLSPELDARDWEVRIEANGVVLLTQTVTVVADTVTDVDVAAETQPAAAGGAPNATVNLIRKAQTVISALRTKRFADLFPVGAGNPFRLENLLRTIPGFTQGAAGQIFARGEQNPGLIYINGVRLPDLFVGQLGETVTANLISNLEAMTGGLPAQYGSLASSVLNVNLKGGTLQPRNAFNLFGGTFATFDGQVVLSGQTGRALSEPDASGRAERSFAYFANFTGRRTDNATAAPQPDDQEANNSGGQGRFFGNFDYRPGLKDHFNLLVNYSPNKTDKANRTGLGSSWPTGGLGFGGYFGSGDNRGDGGLLSQEELGIDEFQEALAAFGFLTWKRKQSDTTDWMLSFGSSNIENDLRNDNPPVGTDPFPIRSRGKTSLPYNSSQEFNPTIRRDNKSWQGQGEFHRKTGRHDFRLGFFIDSQDGRESYHMPPGSQLALNALWTADPQLVPDGRPVMEEDPKGGLRPVLDELGNEVYIPTSSISPVVRTDTKRENRSFFMQDEWRASDRFTVNFGARWDSYLGEQSRGFEDADDDMVSPRVNMAYQYDHRTMIRASFNRLFQPPPLVQGAVIGANPKAARATQFDLSFERSLGPTSSMKLTGFHKKTNDPVYIRQLVEGLQEGPLAGVNLDTVISKGIELTLNLTPPDGKGLSGFLTWTNGLVSPHGMASDGQPAPDYMPTDQRNTITAGMNFMFGNGSAWALSFDYGSGLPQADLFGLDERRGRSRVNFRFQSAPTALGAFGGFTVDVENLLDSRTVIGFNSPVNGTRFQQGRRITISAFSEFLSR